MRHGPRIQMSRATPNAAAVKNASAAGRPTTAKGKSQQQKALWGTWRSHLANLLEGVSKGFEKNLEITAGVLRDVRRQGITDDELRQAKSKIGSRVVRGSERPMGRMQAIGMSWIYLHEYRIVEDEIADFDAVTLKTIRKVLDKYPLDRVTTLALGPLETLPMPEGNGEA